ncbi:hypothetical protein G5B38_21555 (plasmid) [Pseudohalocynthiibacter aestuariivivens]|nr:tetratricopeptide repeat protein [Pseudohalocynthiibacter aestuariivivens]QIE48193.1 hypothetical protein G5B38_21555 [Pseudohalocynthiibacter aestuariivivens]
MEYFDLGTYSWPVTTEFPVAQQWFDRGLAWIYGYNHEEAIVCFENALKEDPNCAMAHWGIAYAIGPNYNRWWFTYSPEERAEVLQQAHTALRSARALISAVSTLEAALIEALPARYPTSPDTDEFGPYNDAYGNEMRQVFKTYGDNLNVRALYVEALMNRTPWKLWNLQTGEPAENADTEEIIAAMDHAFATNPKAWEHAGLLHLYIHALEMSPHPERALRHGDALGGLIPDAGHLWHMPTHIDVLCGNYQMVVERNHRATLANAKFYSYRGGNNFYTYYRLHDYHFKVYGAMFQGQRSVALRTADEMTQTIPESVIIEHGDFLECYLSIKQHVRIRFGMWKDILAEPLPEKPEVYSYSMATLRYARTVALANLRRVEEAEAEMALFYEALEKVPKTRRVVNNLASDVLGIAEQMMLGELEYHKGNHELAFSHLRESIRRDDTLEYDEPWGWMQPTRHALGALLMEQGQLEEAESIYRADLGFDDTLSRACQHPGNVWSLRGLMECLERRREATELPHVRHSFEMAAARSEVPVKVSCFCRTAGIT